MRKYDNIRDLLGITQEDLAALLKISRTQLSMYEIGKRELPSTAIIQLAEMLRYLQEDASKSADTTSLLKEQAIQKEKALEEMRKENHFKQLVLEKKLNVLEKKYKANFSAFQLTKYLEKQDTENGKLESQLLKTIERKASAELNKNGIAMITKYKIEKEVLQAEEKIILQFLKNRQ
jgi:transcriptional regulator with XRE-family HTH domain